MPKKKRIIKDFTIGELSTVDVPAHQGAQALLHKRKGLADDISKALKGEGIEKRLFLTTSVDGHTHLIMDQIDGGSTDFSEGTEGDFHNHPWIRDEDGNIRIGEAAGHTHEVDAESVAKLLKTEVKDMPEKDNSELLDQLKKANDTITELTAKVEKAEKLSKLSDVERSHFNDLAQDDQDEFLAKSNEDRAQDIKKAMQNADDENPVIYKSKHTGTVVRKNDGEAMLALVKHNDELESRVRKAEEDAENLEINKQIGDLKLLKGDDAAKFALVKAINGIEDQSLRDSAFEIIKAKSQLIEKLSKNIGQDYGEVESGGPDGEIQNLADEIHKNSLLKGDGKLTKEQAYAQALASPEGRELYKQHRLRRAEVN